MIEIIPLIRQVKFFKEKESNDEYFLDIIKKLQYEFIPKGDIVFERGNTVLYWLTLLNINKFKTKKLNKIIKHN